eukprot:EG_transcript_11842
MTHAYYPASTASTQPLRDDDWDARSVASLYSEMPYTISGSEAGTIAPYTINRDARNPIHAGRAFVPSTMTPFTVTPGPAPFAAALGAPSGQVPYGVPVPLSAFAPSGTPLPWPAPQNSSQLFYSHQPQITHTIPQTFPPPARWPPPLNAPYWPGAPATYFPAPHLPLTQHQPYDPAPPYWPPHTMGLPAGYYSDSDSLWPPTNPQKPVRREPGPARPPPPAKRRAKSGPPPRKTDSGLLGGDKDDVALTAALVLGTIALGALLFI